MHSGWYWMDELQISADAPPADFGAGRVETFNAVDNFIATLLVELSDAMEDDTSPLDYLNDDKESGNESKG